MSIQEIDPLTANTIQLLRDNEEEVTISLEDVQRLQFYSLNEAELTIERPPPSNARQGSNSWALWLFPLIAFVVFTVMLVEYNKLKRKENNARWKMLTDIGSFDDYLLKESGKHKSDAYFPIPLQNNEWEKLEAVDSASNEAIIEGLDTSERNLGCEEFIMPSIKDIQDDGSSDLNSEERKELDDELTELKYFER